MKVLLVQPFKDTGLSYESWPPVGLGYLATSLRRRGHVVSILDCLKGNYCYESFVQTVIMFSPHMIGFNLFSISVPYVIKCIDMVKKEMPVVQIVLGGPHVSSLPERVLQHFKKADFAIRGEGEIPLTRLVDCIESRTNNFHEIPGLIYRKNGEIKINNPYFPENIEDYGFPAWDLIRPQDYFRYHAMGSGTVPVFFSRGCPFPCTFCAAKVTSGQTLRRRGFDHIFEELHYLKNEYGAKRFVIEDEGFGVNKKFILAFCDRVKKENFKASFALGVGMRLDIVDRHLLETMLNCNFEKTIALGIESGSQRILELMKKHTSLEIILEKVNLMKDVGFEPTGYFILGYPTETREEMKETIRFALKLPIKEASFTPFQPLPSTAATKMLIRNKELPKDYDFSREEPGAITYAPDGITTKELERIRKNAVLRFYLRPKIFFRYLLSKSMFLYAVKKFVRIFFKSNTVLHD